MAQLLIMCSTPLPQIVKVDNSDWLELEWSFFSQPPIIFSLGFFFSKIGCGIRDVRVPMGQLPIMLARSIFVPQRI